ncbi:MAG: hypothetical protein AB7V27_15975 [Candidatus Binatia bacterium]
MGRVALLALTLLGGVGCGAGSYTVEPQAPPLHAGTGTQRFYVMLPPPGPQGDEPGREITARIVAALQSTRAEVQSLPSADRAAALSTARGEAWSYVIQPLVTTWKVSAAPPFTAGQIGLRLELIDAASGSVLRTAMFDNVSPIWSVTKVSPAALLDGRFDAAVRDLVGMSPA